MENIRFVNVESITADENNAECQNFRLLFFIYCNEKVSVFEIKLIL